MWWVPWRATRCSVRLTRARLRGCGVYCATPRTRSLRTHHADAWGITVHATLAIAAIDPITILHSDVVLPHFPHDFDPAHRELAFCGEPEHARNRLGHLLQLPFD